MILFYHIGQSLVLVNVFVSGLGFGFLLRVFFNVLVELILAKDSAFGLESKDPK